MEQTNEEKIALYNRLSKLSTKLLKENNLKDRNKLCEPIRRLYKEIDWGYKVGDRVLLFQSNRKYKAKITEHLDTNYFAVKKDEGGEIIVPAMLIIKDVGEEMQLSLF